MVSKRKIGDKRIKFEKYWTVKEAAQLLNKRCEGKITVADVFELACNCKLKMSVEILKKVYAKIYLNRNEQEGEKPEKGQTDVSPIASLMEVYSDRILYDVIEPIDGYFDLPMKGGEILSVNYELQKLKTPSAVKRINLAGSFVERDGKIYQLQEYVKQPEIHDHRRRPNFSNPIEIPENSNNTETTNNLCQTKSYGFCDSLEDNEALRQKKPWFFGLGEDHKCSHKFQVRLDNPELDIHDGWRPARCLPEEIRFVLHTRALNDFLEENIYREADKKMTGKIKGQSYEEKNKTDTVKLKKQNSAKRPTKKEETSILSIDEGGSDSLKPVKDSMVLPLKRGAVPEEHYLRLKDIIGSLEDGIKPIIPVSRATWYAGVKSGRYPKSYPLSEGTVGWKESEIMALLDVIGQREK